MQSNTDKLLRREQIKAWQDIVDDLHAKYLKARQTSRAAHAACHKRQEDPLASVPAQTADFEMYFTQVKYENAHKILTRLKRGRKPPSRLPIVKAGGASVRVKRAS